MNAIAAKKNQLKKSLSPAFEKEYFALIFSSNSFIVKKPAGLRGRLSIF